MNVLFVDLETSKKPNHNPWNEGSFLCSIGAAYNDQEIKTWLVQHKTEVVYPFPNALKELQDLIDKSDLIVAHNAKFELNWLKHVGINLKGKRFWCTEIADYLINGQYNKISYSLNNCAARHGLGQKEDGMAEYWDSGYETDEIPVDVHIPYLTQDVSLLRDLYNKQLPFIDNNSLSLLAALSFEVTDMLSDMELNGVKFDIKRAWEEKEKLSKEVLEIDKRLVELAGFDFNPGSSQQMSAFLFGGTIKQDYIETYQVTLKSGEVKDKSRKAVRFVNIPGLGFTPVEGSEGATEGVYSVDKDNIKLLFAETPEQEEVKELLLKRSALDQIGKMFWSKGGKGGLIAVVGKDGGIHPTFNQTVTVTGRLSSKNPNGQNLPRKGSSPIKSCFLPRNGVIVNVDLSQTEFRMASELSRDEVMLNEINGGIDTHADNAIRFFDAGKLKGDSDAFDKVRTLAKIFTFRLLYGGSAMGFFKDGSMPRYTLKKWQDIEAAYLDKYRGLSEWWKSLVSTVYEQGYLRNPSGRILRFVPVSRRGVLEYNESQIYNYPVQSSSADVMFLAMAAIRRRFKEAGIRSTIVLQVHDSLVIDAFPDEVEKIHDISIGVFKELPELCKKYWGWDFIVPMTGECEVGPTYGDVVKFQYVVNPTRCVVSDKKKNEIEIPVTNYVDLISHTDYIAFSKEHKIAKIAFKE